MQARDVMTDKVVTVGLGHSVRHAVSKMLDHGISGLPVVGDDGSLVGVITEGDLLRRAELGEQTLHSSDKPDASGYVKARSWRISDVMSRKLLTISENASLADVARMMTENGVKRLPVLRDGVMVGIVSRADLLGAIVASGNDQTASGDEAIERAINTRLHADLGFSPTATGARVENRCVTLWGEVETEALREAARVAAEGIRGVNGVTNTMTVARKAD